jgi:hypothetical protein
MLAAAALAGSGVVPGGPLAAYSAGLGLAVLSSLAGFALLGRATTRSGHGFAVLLLALFLARVALTGSFGLALFRLAPGVLAVGLLALAGYHFVFMVIEIALIARPPRGARETSRRSVLHAPR